MTRAELIESATKAVAAKREDVVREDGIDDEAAHMEEDELMRLALAWIRRLSEDEGIREIAEIGLSTQDLEFARWYA